MGRRFLIILILPLLLVFSLGGCAGTRPYLQEFKVPPGVDACSVGVLPLINKSGYGQGELVLYRILLSQLVGQRTWRVALEGDVRKIYRELKLRPWHSPNPEQMQIIASRLGVDILIGGEILEMEERVVGERINPRIKLHLQVFNGKDGTLHWATYHSRQGTDYRKLMHFGLSNSVSQLGKKIIQEILTLWEKEGLIACSS